MTEELGFWTQIFSGSKRLTVLLLAIVEGEEVPFSPETRSLWGELSQSIALLSVVLSEPTAGQAQPFCQADGTYQGKIRQGGGLTELLILICLFGGILFGGSRAKFLSSVCSLKASIVF